MRVVQSLMFCVLFYRSVLSLCPFSSGHCVVDLLTANYPFGIFKHLLLVTIVLSIYPLLITTLVYFKHLLLVVIVLSIYPQLITSLVSFKHLLLVAIVLSIYPLLIIPLVYSKIITSGHCVVDLPTLPTVY